jgi:hypothetical protein
MSSNISENTLELLLKEIIILNKKIVNLEIKIDCISNQNIINKKKYINDIDWLSVHLY